MVEVPHSSQDEVLQDRFNQELASELNKLQLLHDRLVASLELALQETDYATFKSTLQTELS